MSMMHHPEVLLIPAVMLADYFLTVSGAVLREKGYSSHFSTEHYELNPAWQNVIAKKNWFNPRHLAVVAIVTAFFIYLSEGPENEETLLPILGFFAGLYGPILGRHISNILIFDHIRRNPEQITGAVKMSHSFVLRLSGYQTLQVLLPILAIGCFAGSSFTLGALAGIGALITTHLIWFVMAARRGRK